MKTARRGLLLLMILFSFLWGSSMTLRSLSKWESVIRIFGNGAQPSAVAQIAEALPCVSWDLWERKELQLSAGNQCLDVALYHVLDDASRFSDFSLLCGKFPDKDNERRRDVALSETAAFALFQINSGDCLGRHVFLGGEEFLVVGVYRKESAGILGLLTMTERYSAVTTQPLDRFADYELFIRTFPKQTDLVLDQIRGMLALVVSDIRIESLDWTARSGIQWIKRGFLLLGAILFMTGYRWAARSTHRFTMMFRHTLCVEYFGKAVRMHFRALVKNVLIWLTLIISAIFFVERLDLSTLIPLTLLPPADFNLLLWYEAAKEHFIQINLMTLPKCMQSVQVLALAQLALVQAILLIFVCLALAWWLFRIEKRHTIK